MYFTPYNAANLPNPANFTGPRVTGIDRFHCKLFFIIPSSAVVTLSVITLLFSCSTNDSLIVVDSGSSAGGLACSGEVVSAFGSTLFVLVP